MIQKSVIATTTLLFLVVLLSWLPLKTMAETRVALLIGNADYANGRLKNPVNDAREMARTLQQLGFETEILENANKREMVTTINNFGKKLRQSDVALFYFSGHGFQHEGKNWLQPLEADIELAIHVEFEALNAERILAEMEGGSGERVNIVIIDACRSNPNLRNFRSVTKGLAVPQRSPVGSIIAFATAPGTVAYDRTDGSDQNSPYVSELTRHMLTPGIPIEEVFKRTRAAVEAKTARMSTPQVPWENTSLKGDFYFIPAESVVINSASTSPAVTSESQSISAKAWELIKESDNPTIFELFIQKYPEAPERDLAEFRLMTLSAPSDSSIEIGSQIETEPQTVTLYINFYDWLSDETAKSNSTFWKTSKNKADDIVYVGEISNGVPNGQGALSFANGDKYVGEFKDGKFHGQGTATWANGDKYVGAFKDDKFHGQGTFTYPDGRTESGLWRNGNFVNENEGPSAAYKRLLATKECVSCDLRNADLGYANLSEANLRNADLRNADLSGAYLRNANLRNANLRNANLRNADLSEANLRNANLSGADLTYTKLRGATFCKTTMPDGSINNKDC